MSWSLIAHAAAGSTDGATATTSAVDTTGASVLIVGVASEFDLCTITDSYGNTWSALPSANDGGSVAFAQLFYCANPIVGPSHTFTSTTASPGSPSLQTMFAAAFSGAPASPLDQHSSATGSSSSATVQPGSVTPTMAGELCVTVAALHANETYTIDSGYTIIDQLEHNPGVWIGGALAYLVQGSAAATDPTWDQTDADYAAATIATFEGSGGGGGGGTTSHLLSLVGVGQ